MAHLAPRLDLDMAGKLVANFLQSWLQVGLDEEAQAPQTLHDSQDPTAPSSEDGLHLSAPVDHGPSAPSPGEHRQAGLASVRWLWPSALTSLQGQRRNLPRLRMYRAPSGHDSP